MSNMELALLRVPARRLKTTLVIHVDILLRLSACYLFRERATGIKTYSSQVLDRSSQVMELNSIALR